MCSALPSSTYLRLQSGFSPGAVPGPFPLKRRSLKGSLGVKRCEQGAEGTCRRAGASACTGQQERVGRAGMLLQAAWLRLLHSQSHPVPPVSCPLPLGGSCLGREWREAALEGSSVRANRAPSLHARLLCPGVQERSRQTQPLTWSHLGEETGSFAAYLSEPKLEHLPQCQYLTLSRGRKGQCMEQPLSPSLCQTPHPLQDGLHVGVNAVPPQTLYLSRM